VSFVGSNKRLAVEFDAIYTAEDIGSYKPNPANFAYMLSHLEQRGIEPEVVLHTAQSLFHDHAPAKKFGLTSAWIDRRHEQDGWGATMPSPDTSYDFRFTSMADMVKAHQEDLRA
jgi:FMN phosphatase YigB (HAD superfamily)